MTKERILEVFKDINQMYNNANMYDDLSKMLDELVEDSKKSVEPEIEKCEDCINRKDIIKKLNNLCNNICEYSKKQRKSMCDACNLSLVFDMINNAKSVEPERKPGKWIENDTIRQCNMCRALYSKGQRCGAYHYCHHCGAKMEEVKNDT